MSQSQAGPSTQNNTDSHICQRCHQPLLLDPSVQNLTSSQYNLITSALPSPTPTSQLPASTKLSSLPPSSAASAKVWADSNHIPIPGPSSSRNVAESFILLSESSLLPPSSSNRSNIPTPPQNSNLVSQLHHILSSQSTISHPLCTECTALLTTEFQHLAEELTRERDAYIGFEKDVQRNRERLTSGSSRRSQSRSRRTDDGEPEGLGENDVEGTEDEWAELNRRKRELEDEEEKLRLVLEERERELEVVEEEERRVRRDEEEVEREETEYLLHHSALSTHLSHLQSTLSTAQTHLLLSKSLLAHLESTNVYNDAFQIGHVPLDPSSGAGITVGTINGLRLGGRPTVEWEEINAAWGLTALCLDRVADKVGCVFSGYKIIPLGSYSRIEELPPQKGIYELYASSDLSPARLLQNRRFNYAMIAILDCLKQLIEFGKKRNKGWANNNIEIHKDKISNHSIKLPGISSMPLTLPSMSIMGLGSTSTTATGTGSGSGGNKETDNTAEESWTKACRAVLVVLKRILMVESQMDRSATGGRA
ncbi:hypothetical protein I302_104372 [Kwoniella bestiolae CBS 10118]|uniref:Autophagy-related protein 6 n=1 Tax=Kwoniella bestiolae CBS 10118 TaxID=1296100 RepID=A0A1B9GB49_9TREE|nr:hypothetical protein I302_03080 [Kwoniella bestiolae CBS 10118]OCF28228.1 hypothetical protein I302_03080 [Kwoniella bestiolae CBS 10118]